MKARVRRNYTLIAIGLSLLTLFGQAGADDAVTWQDCPECPLLTRIPGGSFTMGTADGEAGREPDEGPEHRVTIVGELAVGIYEVTRAQFRDFVDATGFQVQAGCTYMDPKAQKWVDDPALNWRSPGFFQDDNHPVTCVNFTDAVAYVTWLSARTGQSYRLPSEAEWEYAARAGTTSSRFWGDSPGRWVPLCERGG